MASRASVEFYVGLALKGRGAKVRDGKETKKGKGVMRREGRDGGGDGDGEGGVMEEAFVIRTFRNGLGVFVSKCVLFSSLLPSSSRPLFFARHHEGLFVHIHLFFPWSGSGSKVSSCSRKTSNSTQTITL